MNSLSRFKKGFVLLALLFNSKASAFGGLTDGVLLSLNASSLSQETQNTHTGSVTKSKLNIQLIDAKLGMITEDGWYFGAIYHGRTQADIFDTDQSSHTGASLGFTLPSGFFAFAHYFFDGQFKDKSADITYKAAAGYGAELGFLMDLTPSFYYGINYAYRNIEYKKRAPESTTFSKYVHSEHSPMICLAFLF